MIVTVTNYKGGTSKTISSIHIAAYLQKDAPTLLIDGDANRSATAWARRGKLPFKVIDERGAAKYAREFKHIVIDTAARPSLEDLKALAEGCDLMVIPTPPEILSLDATVLVAEALQSIGWKDYRVLLSMLPPPPRKDGDDARVMFDEAGIPVFNSTIRRLVAYEKSALQGVPVYEVKDPRAKEAWLDYQKLGKEILR